MPSITLPINATQSLDIIGEPVRVSGFTNTSEIPYTLAVYLQAFKGRIHLEYSMDPSPATESWHPIYLAGTDEFLTFPDTNYSITEGQTGTKGYSFKSNALWMRARVDRSYLYPIPPTNPELANLGIVRRIVLSFASTEIVSPGSSTGITRITSSTPAISISNPTTTPAISINENEINLRNLRGTLVADQIQPGTNGQVLSVINGRVTWAIGGNTAVVTSVAGRSGAITLTPSDIVGISPVAISGNLSDVSGTLPVSKGGTGSISFLSRGILVGNGSSIATITPPNLQGQVLTFNGSSFVWSVPPVSAGINVRYNGVSVGNSAIINFAGSAVSVTNNTGIPTVTVQSSMDSGNARNNVFTFRVNYSGGNILSVTDLPLNWSATINGQNTTVIHNFTGRPSFITAMGFKSGSFNAYQSKVPGGNYMMIKFNPQTPNTFELMNMGNAATGADLSEHALVDIYFV